MQDMKKDKLLGRVHKNSQVGLFTLPKLNELVENPSFKQYLNQNEEEYKNIYYSAERLKDCHSLLDMSALAKVRTRAMLNMSTYKDKSTSHIAEMLIMGSTAGIIDMKKSLRKYPDAPASTKELAENLVEIEEKSIEVLKQYL
jgi:hypothetical protein